MTKILYGAGRDTREMTNLKFVWVVVVVFAQSFSCQTSVLHCYRYGQIIGKISISNSFRNKTKTVSGKHYTLYFGRATSHGQ